MTFESSAFSLQVIMCTYIERLIIAIRIGPQSPHQPPHVIENQYINLFVRSHALSIDNDPQVFAASQLPENRLTSDEFST